jgi:hypothetical protein
MSSKSAASFTLSMSRGMQLVEAGDSRALESWAVTKRLFSLEGEWQQRGERPYLTNANSHLQHSKFL